MVPKPLPRGHTDNTQTSSGENLGWKMGAGSNQSPTPYSSSFTVSFKGLTVFRSEDLLG